MGIRQGGAAGMSEKCDLATITVALRQKHAENSPYRNTMLLITIRRIFVTGRDKALDKTPFLIITK
jgi:hypothetical protein